MEQITKVFASVVSEIQQNDIYLTVKARLFEAPEANLNGVRVTTAFLEDIVEHEEKYIGIPVYADIRSLADGNYKHLGHLYDARTGEFHSTQIGSFYHYEKEITDRGEALIGYARIMKRNKAVCKAISELYMEGALKFSFEISCGSYKELDDNTLEIDKSADNYLEGAAIVTFPACEDAVALDLVAEVCNLFDAPDITEKPKGDSNMEDTINAVVSVASVEGCTVISTDKVDIGVMSTVAEAESAECKKNTAEDMPEEKQEHGPDCDCEECTRKREEENAACKKKAENETAEQEVVTEVAEETVEIAEVSENKNDTLDAIFSIFAELKNTVNELRNEIASLKEASKEEFVAEIKETKAENPFIASFNEMENGSDKKYSLLESEPKSNKEHSLLDKA